MVYKKDLSKGLFLDSYEILIEWKISENDFLEKIKDIDYEKEEHKDFKCSLYRIKTSVLNLDKIFRFTFNFVNKKLRSISVTNYKYFIKNINDSYSVVNKFLEKNLGSPNKIYEVNDEVTTVWKFRLIKIVHSLINRFGLEERLQIIIR